MIPHLYPNVHSWLIDTIPLVLLIASWHDKLFLTTFRSYLRRCHPSFPHKPHTVYHAVPLRNLPAYISPRYHDLCLHHFLKLYVIHKSAKSYKCEFCYIEKLYLICCPNWDKDMASEGCHGLPIMLFFNFFNSPVLQFGAPSVIDSGEAKIYTPSWENIDK